ncbi:MAG TPA: nucleotidyltransferase family protein, partial [Anaerolinea sp.]|nr:nucleotidyltransferase family protein [Anaerolinea sp.]
RYQVKRMALFGSVLRDDFRPDSDIDVLVVFSPSARTSFMTLGKMKRELSAMFQRQVDLVPQEGLKPSIRDSVLASAQEVYAA